jgi:hypothetical protein
LDLPDLFFVTTGITHSAEITRRPASPDLQTPQLTV